MSRIPRLFLSLLALAVLVTLGLAEEEMAWFDLEKCAICSKLDDEKGLMENLHWEAHLISSGMLAVAVVPEAYEDAFLRAAEGMEARLKEMESGEPTPVCGFCRSYGELVMAGARIEEIESSVGYVSLMTSTDPEVVAAIHVHARRAIAEAKRVLESVAARKTAGGAPGGRSQTPEGSERGPRERSGGAFEPGEAP